MMSLLLTAMRAISHLPVCCAGRSRRSVVLLRLRPRYSCVTWRQERGSQWKRHAVTQHREAGRRIHSQRICVERVDGYFHVCGAALFRPLQARIHQPSSDTLTASGSTDHDGDDLDHSMRNVQRIRGNGIFPENGQSQEGAAVLSHQDGTGRAADQMRDTFSGTRWPIRLAENTRQALPVQNVDLVEQPTQLLIVGHRGGTNFHVEPRAVPSANATPQFTVRTAGWGCREGEARP